MDKVALTKLNPVLDWLSAKLTALEDARNAALDAHKWDAAETLLAEITLAQKWQMETRHEQQKATEMSARGEK